VIIGASTKMVAAALVLLTMTGACSSGGSSAAKRRESQQLTPQQMTAYDDAVRVDGGAACGGPAVTTGLTDGHFVLTTAHGVAGTSAVTVTGRSGRQTSARVLAFDPELDVAWLFAPGLPSRPTQPAEPTDTIAPAFVFAFPPSGTVTIYQSAQLTRTRVAAPDVYGRHPVNRDVYSLTLDRPAGPGVEGAPVLDHDGRLLGIVFATSPSDPKTVTAIAGDDIAASTATHDLQAIKDPATAKPVSSVCR
jgi:hypothetical protein